MFTLSTIRLLFVLYFVCECVIRFIFSSKFSIVFIVRQTHNGPTSFMVLSGDLYVFDFFLHIFRISSDFILGEHFHQVESFIHVNREKKSSLQLQNEVEE